MTTKKRRTLQYLRRTTLLLIGVLISTVAIGHTDEEELGAYAEGPGLRFFEILNGAVHFQHRPLTLEEAVATSTVIGKGNFAEVIPGRSVSTFLIPDDIPINTVFLKIVPSNLLRGARQDYYLVGTIAPREMLSELKVELYTGEVVFMLQPASNILQDPKIAVSAEAQAEWMYGAPLYSLTKRSTLFTISGTGNLSSPIHVDREFADLYEDVRSLDELESRISEIQGGQYLYPETEGGSQEWGETEELGNNSEPRASGEMREGLNRIYYESGQLQAEFNVRSGEPNGRGRYWFENGQLAMDTVFRNGERVECEAWMRDGSPDPGSCP